MPVARKTTTAKKAAPRKRRATPKKAAPRRRRKMTGMTSSQRNKMLMAAISGTIGAIGSVAIVNRIPQLDTDLKKGIAAFAGGVVLAPMLPPNMRPMAMGMMIGGGVKLATPVLAHLGMGTPTVMLDPSTTKKIAASVRTNMRGIDNSMLGVDNSMLGYPARSGGGHYVG